MTEKDNEDLRRLMEEISPHVESEFNKDSLQYMIWKENVKHNSLKTK